SRGGVGAIASQGWLAIFPAGSRHSPVVFHSATTFQIKNIRLTMPGFGISFKTKLLKCVQKSYSGTS
ncbi:hypothetical protein, partial [Methylomonas sp. MgM2]